jgi:oxaloacetate decarboxylase gamma subunit
MDSLNQALGLLVIGMTTVFIVLWLVTVIGTSVIELSNRFYQPGAKDNGTPPTGGVDKEKMAAIVAAVNVLTNGKGVVDSVEKK